MLILMIRLVLEILERKTATVRRQLEIVEEYQNIREESCKESEL